MTVTETAVPQAPTWWKTSASASGEADPMSSAEPEGDSAEFGFADFVDVINPLHHIPIIGNIYRALSGDEISETSRMTGGALWGGPFGLVTAFANTITERETGQDMGETALAWLGGDEPADADAQLELLAAATETTGQANAAESPAAPAPAPVAAAVEVPTPAELADGPDAGSEPAFAAAQQIFVGTKANRLDSFIRRANAVRTPLEAPPAGGALTSAAAFDTRSKVAAVSGNPTPLAAEGGTDVAQWMMRALDKYEMMQTRDRT